MASSRSRESDGTEPRLTGAELEQNRLMHIDGLRPFLRIQLAELDPEHRVAAAAQLAIQLSTALDEMETGELAATKVERARLEGVVLALSAVGGAVEHLA